MKKELQLSDLKKAIEKLKSKVTFNELEYYMKAGAKVQDLVLFVPAHVMHSGSMATAYGPLLIVTNKFINQATLMKKPERMFTPDYLTS
jgi:hypothetical protein